MKVSVQISRGIESLFGTHDENIRVLEKGLNVSTSLLDDCLEIEGTEPTSPRRQHLEEYVALVKEGHSFANGDLNSYLRVVTADPQVSLRSLVISGRQRNFGKKIVVPKTINQRRYLEAIERNDMVLGSACGHRQDLPGCGHGYLRAAQQARKPHHPDAPRGGSGRAARLSARHAPGKGGPLPPAAL